MIDAVDVQCRKARRRLRLIEQLLEGSERLRRNYDDPGHDTRRIVHGAAARLKLREQRLRAERAVIDDTLAQANVALTLGRRILEQVERQTRRDPVMIATAGRGAPFGGAMLPLSRRHRVRR